MSHIVKNSPRKQAAITYYMLSTPTSETLKKKIKELKPKRNFTSKIELNVLRSIYATSTSKKKKKRAIKLINQKIKRRLKVSRETLDQFYKRGDISRPVPRVRNISKFRIMYIMETTLKNAFERFRDEHDDLNAGIAFSTFAQHRPKNVKLASTNLVTCQCEICVNILQRINTLRRVTVQCRMKNPGVTFPNVPVTVYELNKLTLCSNQDLKCHERCCDLCGPNKIMEYFSPFTSVDRPEAEVRWMKFEKCEKERKQYKDDKLVITQKSTKEYVNHSGSVNELLDELQHELETFSLHLYNAFDQLNAFNSLIDNLQDKWLVSVQDFSENYAAKYQFEPQSAYYDKTSMTLHPTVLLYREGDQIVREGVTFVTEDLKHDHSAVWTFRKKVLEHINFTPLYHVGWSDGCSAQYKSREPFLDVSFNEHDFSSTYEHCFYGSRHAKGPSDAEGAVVKNWVARKVSNEWSPCT
ncbi:hypothetical protein SNE40_013192 [Patella caerulea]|uniref:Uncharacterized protein n=1 Tax=Patella caerulea TaxID=87958 RepID=A0AAN8JJ41_PATCE